MKLPGFKHKSLAVILFVGLLVRWGPVFFSWELADSPDAVDYREIAISLTEGRGFAYKVDQESSLTFLFDKTPGAEPQWVTTAGRLPGYPLFLSVIYSLVRSFRVVQLIQGLLGVATVLFLYMVARSLSSESSALVTAVGAALCPNLIFFCLEQISECLFVFVLSLLLWLVVSWIKTWRFKWACLAALANGALVLVRAEGVFYAFAVLVVVLMFRRERMRVVGAYAAIMALFLTPWTLRNYLVFHDFIPLSTVGGYNFFIGSRVYGELDRPIMPKWEQYPELRREIQGKNEAEFDRLLYKASRDYIRLHPGRHMVTYIKKIVDYWRPTLTPRRMPEPFARLSVLMMLPFFGLALLGATSRTTRDPPRLLLIVMIACCTLLASVYIFNLRHRVACVDSLVIVMAAWGVERIAAWLAKSSDRKS